MRSNIPELETKSTACCSVMENNERKIYSILRSSVQYDDSPTENIDRHRSASTSSTLTMYLIDSSQQDLL